MKDIRFILGGLLLLLLFGCGVANDQKVIVDGAIGQIEKCKTLGEAPFTIKGKYLVWDLSTQSLHSAHNLLPKERGYYSGGGNVTVFLVTAKQNQLVGKYSISGEPGYRQWVDVHVVQAPEMKAIGTHQLVSLDPARSRPVRHTPEYGDPTPPLAEWIKQLPMEMVHMKSATGNT